MKAMRLEFRPPNFPRHTQPAGLLRLIPEHQALFYYYVLAISGWKRQADELVLEGEKDPVPNYEQLFRNCALMYGCDIETLANYWPIIDAEIDRFNSTLDEGQRLTKLPDPLKFNNTLIVVKGH